MPCTGSGPCNCSAGCPLPAGVASSLGFIGTPACCRAPCPAFPLHKVVICISLNDNTLVKIQRGCASTSSLVDLPSEDCNIDWSFGREFSSDGRKCQLVNFTETVTDGSFIRLRFCTADFCSPCGETDLTACGQRVQNQLVKFVVDGVNYKTQLQLIANAGGAAEGCYSVDCFSTACCDPDVDINLNDITAGTEIVFGPIGTSIPAPHA